MTLSDHELIALVIYEDDRGAFGELVQRHQSAVRRFLRHLTRGDAATADDLAQETFLQAYRSLPRFRGDAGFTTWLLGIAHNHWRNARRQQQRDLRTLEQSEGDEAVDAPTMAIDLQHDLSAALRRLTPEEQHVIHLTYQHGLSHGETAAVLGCPLGTAKTHLARGKEKLRQHLASWNPLT